MTALACGGVRKTYGAFVALDDVAMTVDPGEILGLAGPNGAGKTTLFDVLSGRTRPDHGSVTLGERSITSASTHGRARLGLARSFQDARLFGGLTVHQTVCVAIDRPLRSWDPITNSFGMTPLERSSPCARAEPTAAARAVLGP